MDQLMPAIYLVFNALQWPIEKTRQVIWDNLQGHGRTEWQHTLADLEKALDIAYQDILTDFDSTWGGQRSHYNPE
jgi:hypothetical protein